MKEKEYTLYFKGINKYGHEHTLKIVSLNLKKLDEYTANYNNFLELYNSLDEEIKEFIKNELSYKIDIENEDELSNCFFVTDEDFSPIMDVIFNKDLDVLYITLDELTKLLINYKMTFDEYQKILFKTNVSDKIKNKYEFFEYLYKTYVLNQRIACMIDVYDANQMFNTLDSDELILAAIATDKDNIMVLCKKFGQNLESRRNLALKYKNLASENNKLLDQENINERIVRNIDDIRKMQKVNFLEFKKTYEKEYS